MAYKFQLGAARLSGSTTFEDNVSFSQLSASGQIAAGGNLTTAGTVRFQGVADAAVDVAADSLYFKDADGLMKEEAISDLAASFAGDGLAAASGVLSVGVDDSSIETSGDALRVKALGITNGMLSGSISDDKLNQLTTADKVAGSAVQLAGTSAIENNSGLQLKAAVAGDGLGFASQVLSVNVDDSSIETSGDALRVKAAGITDAMLNDDVATGLAGDGLAAASGVLAVQVSGAVVIASDYVGLSGSMAGAGLTYNGGVNSISALRVGEIANGGIAALDEGIKVDLSGLAAAAVDASADSIAIIDATDSSTKKESIADLATAMAGTGIGASSGAFNLDLNELSAAAVDASADSIAIIDATDNTSKKESIADLATAMAGVGLTAVDGAFKVNFNTVTGKADGDTLQVGFNYLSADLAAAATMTLPASPAVGDIIIVKAKGGVSDTNYVLINRAGSQTIDGETSIRIESPFGAVSMVYVASNDWRLF